jgi:DNA-binding NtrC family response regulator
MHAEIEDSPALRRPSNGDVRHGWAGLIRACRTAVSAPRRTRLDELVSLAGAACGAERVFLVRASDRPDAGGFHIVAASSTRADGSRVPSRSVMRDSIRRARAAVLLDTDGSSTSAVAHALSVRSLGLRSIVSAPVPLPPPQRMALVLDSSRGFRLSIADLRASADAFAGLVALAWRDGVGREESEVDGPAVENPEVEIPGVAAYESPAYRAMLAWVRRIAPSELPVLVEGESGSGKEGVSRALHRFGPRRDGPLVAINGTALPETLLEAELFGAVRGAYTGSDRDRIGLFCQADGGTLFLDEVGDMSPSMQAKLLRVLDTGRVRPIGGVTETAVDVRVVAATHRNLRRRVAEGRFRADLYYRLAVLRVEVPPLRERLEDLPLLVADLVPRLRRETGCTTVRLAADAWEILRVYAWPGNVRELHSALARAVLRSSGREIRGSDFDLLSGEEGQRTAAAVTLEARMIEAALHASGGSIAGAASHIGWSRQKLYRRMEALGVGRT